MPNVDHAFSLYCLCGAAWEVTMRHDPNQKAIWSLQDSIRRTWRDLHDGDRCLEINREDYRKMMREREAESITR
jgi:hypothetical protein